MQAIVRAWLPALAVLAVGWLCTALSEPHTVAAANAPVDAFSAQRAQRMLTWVLGPERPHPLGSSEESAVQARIVAQLRALGIPVQTYRAFTCNTWRGFSFIPCATVNDILAEVTPGKGRAVLMIAHADSVAAGPGAADDGAGVACVLEAARALRTATANSRTQGRAAHPVLALISDGEEAGLLGAAAFLQNPALAARVGAAVNVEARGTRGPSLLFQMSPGDAQLLHLYATHVHFSVASSLFADIYRHLPNDTDLTLFIRAGVPSVNFAIAENVQAYHSPLDRLAALSPASLQMQGDNLLAMVRALRHTPFERLRGSDALYVSTLGHWLPRMPAAAALPLALAVLVLLGWARRRASRAAGQPAPPTLPRRAALAPLTLIGGSVLLGQGLALIARGISGALDPGYAHPLALLTGLELGLWLMLLLTSALAEPQSLIGSSWLWIALLGLAAAIWLPALAPYLLWPAGLAVVLLWLAASAPGGWSGRWGRGAALIGALAMLILWLPLAAASQAMLGLRVPAIFMLSASVGLTTLLPLLATGIPARTRTLSLCCCAVGALLCAVTAGLLPTYSAAAPERLNLLYVESGAQASWVADTTWEAPARTLAPLPLGLRRAAHFRPEPIALPGLVLESGYVAPAGPAVLPLPTAELQLRSSAEGVRTASLALRGSTETAEMALYIPSGAGLLSLDIGGQHLAAPAGWTGSTALLCLGADCRDERVVLRLAAQVPEQPAELRFVEHRWGLPARGAALQLSRGPAAMASQNGDETLLLGSLPLPPRR